MTPPKRVLIFAGGTITPHFKDEIRLDDYIIGADYGAYFLIEHGIVPDMSVGDFDSVQPEQLQQIQNVCKKVIIVDPVNKDLTDAELAFEMAITKQPDEIVMFGVLGSRFDHSLSNIQMMMRALQHQISCSIWDTNNHLTLTGSTATVRPLNFEYISLLPMTTQVTGITIEGFMYPLEDATIRMGQSLGISNKLISDVGYIRIESGLLLIVQSKVE